MANAQSKIVCYCNNVSIERVEDSIRAGARTLAAIYDSCGAGTGPCGGSCRNRILNLVAKVEKEESGTAPATNAIVDTPEALVEAVSLFNRRYYWETHEVLEHVWMDETGPRKKFYQGLIQAAAALYHVLNANPRGVIKLAEESVAKLTAYQPEYMGIPLEDLCQKMTSYAQEAREILGGEKSGFNYDRLPYLMIGQEMEVPSALQGPLKAPKS